MDAPDPEAITQVEVEAPQAQSVTDLNGLSLPLNDATRDAWNALRDAFLSREDDLQATSRPIARQAILNRASGTGLSAPNKILGAGIGMCEPMADDANGTPQSACIVLYVAESMTTQEAIDYLADTYNIDELAATEAYVRVFQTGPIEALSRKSRMRPASGGRRWLTEE